MTSDSYLDQLNPQQREAVVYCDGPQLVIAGAGSGKTRVLTYKIVHLLSLGYRPYKILALTFTNKAAAEMRDRVETLLSAEQASQLWMGTFHSIFARLLRRYADRIGFRQSFTIYDTSDSRSLIKTIVKDRGLDEKVYKDSALLSAISNAKNALISPEMYMADREMMRIDARNNRPETASIYAEYMERCRIAGAMDFDDLLVHTYRLLSTCPDVLDELQAKFDYILVDEYQDTNYAQHLIVSLLAGEGQKVCVVGDDAQSIYSFRGANIRNILDLDRAFPSLRTFKLEQNYRSTQNIINAAGSLIEKNRDQIPKQVFSRNDSGAKIEVVRCYNDFEEGYVVASRIIQKCMDASTGYDSCAVLYRTNAQSRIIEEALRKRSIPYRIYGGLSFYQRKEVKDAISYLRLILNPDDDEALRRVINVPKRAIGDTTVGRLSAAAIAEGVSMNAIISDPSRYPEAASLKPSTISKLQGFTRLLEPARELFQQGADAFTIASRIISDSGLLSSLIHEGTPESISKQENLNELLSGIRQFVDGERETYDGDPSLSAFMTRAALATDQDSDDSDDGLEASRERVTLMTVHAAKGLEFDNVFIVGVEEDLFPSLMAKDSPAGIEEERRLMYVAITRARRFCMITYAASRYRNGMTQAMRPSRFISDLNPSFLRLQTGRDFDEPSPSPRYSTPATPASRPHFAPSDAGSARSLNDLRSPSSASPAPPRNASKMVASMPADDFALHDVSEVSVSARIVHSRFGPGTVIEIPDSDRMTVAFDGDSVVSRTLLFKFAKFVIMP